MVIYHAIHYVIKYTVLILLCDLDGSFEPEIQALSMEYNARNNQTKYVERDYLF
jgi:hypothetical protein